MPPLSECKHWSGNFGTSWDRHWQPTTIVPLRRVSVVTADVLAHRALFSRLSEVRLMADHERVGLLLASRLAEARKRRARRAA
jgi:hypothetical protein